jgi:ATP synthase mitochondrial F1 complex assembly factor 2
LALHGISFTVEVLKSVVLGAGVTWRKFSIPEAVLLARLEEDFQCTHWGRVEWSHDLAQEDAQARVAAASLLTQLSTPSPILSKKVETG